MVVYGSPVTQDSGGGSIKSSGNDESSWAATLIIDKARIHSGRIVAKIRECQGKVGDTVHICDLTIQKLAEVVRNRSANN